MLNLIFVRFLWFFVFSYVNAYCNEYEYDILHKKNIDKSLLQPKEKNGIYCNPDSLSIDHIKKSSAVQYIWGIFSSTSLINLNDIVQKPDIIHRSIPLRITWIGHATCLIQINNLNILTDPVFENCYPLIAGIKAFKRYTPPGISIKNLPKIDIVLISHNHYDHMEEKSLLYLKKMNPIILVPIGLKKWFIQRGFSEKNIIEHNWYDKTKVLKNNNVEFIATPAIHSSMKRDHIKKNESLWIGWMIKGKDKTVYFAGDTAFHEKLFLELKNLFSQIDVALLPIDNANDPNSHLDVDQAMKAFTLIKAKYMIPIHWGTYKFSSSRIDVPYEKLLYFMLDNPEKKDQIIPLHIGESFSLIF